MGKERCLKSRRSIRILSRLFRMCIAIVWLLAVLWKALMPRKIPMLTVDEIRQSGAMIVDGKRRDHQPTARYGSVDEMINEVGKKDPEPDHPQEFDTTEDEIPF